MPFELTVDSVVPWLSDHGLVADDGPLEVTELPGGVSASVIAVLGPNSAVVVKQALPQLRVQDEWKAKTERTDTEAAAMRLCRELTPASVPQVFAHDRAAHVIAMELLPPAARNWQEEIGAGRIHADAATWAGSTLGVWHAATADRADIAARFDDFEAFEQLRLRPFHETVMSRRSDLAQAIAPYLAELRVRRGCLVHGDYAAKNMLVGPPGRWVLDFEVAHVGNPVFDLGFFLSFVVLSAVRWPVLTDGLRTVAEQFLEAYEAAAGEGFAGDAAAVAGHTACLVLARTDGTSPAQFLEPASRARAQAAGTAMLERPEEGLWGWA